MRFFIIDSASCGLHPAYLSIPSSPDRFLMAADVQESLTPFVVLFVGSGVNCKLWPVLFVSANIDSEAERRVFSPQVLVEVEEITPRAIVSMSTRGAWVRVS